MALLRRRLRPGVSLLLRVVLAMELRVLVPESPVLPHDVVNPAAMAGMLGFTLPTCDLNKTTPAPPRDTATRTYLSLTHHFRGVKISY